MSNQTTDRHRSGNHSFVKSQRNTRRYLLNANKGVIDRVQPDSRRGTAGSAATKGKRQSMIQAADQSENGRAGGALLHRSILKKPLSVETRVQLFLKKPLPPGPSDAATQWLTTAQRLGQAAPERFLAALRHAPVLGQQNALLVLRQIGYDAVNAGEGRETVYAVTSQSGDRSIIRPIEQEDVWFD